MINEEVIINTEKLSNEEKKVLESTFAFECCTGYNVTGAKQYKFPKEQLVYDITKSLTRLDNQDFEIDKVSMLRQTIPAILIVLGAGIISTVISHPHLVILPSVILYTVNLLINEKLTTKNKKKLNTEKEIRKTLISKVEEEYEKQIIKEKEIVNEKEQDKAQEVDQEKSTISLEVNTSSEVIAQASNKAKNISDTVVEVQTGEKTQESPKQMIKGKNN